MALSTGSYWQERSLLHEAVESGDVDKVRGMLEGGEFDVNCINRHGQSLLHVAAAKGHFGMVRLLISDFEADVNTHTDGGKTFNVYNNYGETPLHEAASEGHLDIWSEYWCLSSRLMLMHVQTVVRHLYIGLLQMAIWT